MKKFKLIISKIVFFCGLAAMGILTVTAGILFGIIAVIQAATDLIINKLDK